MLFGNDQFSCFNKAIKRFMILKVLMHKECNADIYFSLT